MQLLKIYLKTTWYQFWYLPVKQLFGFSLILMNSSWTKWLVRSHWAQALSVFHCQDDQFLLWPASSGLEDPRGILRASSMQWHVGCSGVGDLWHGQAIVTLIQDEESQQLTPAGADHNFIKSENVWGIVWFKQSENKPTPQKHNNQLTL